MNEILYFTYKCVNNYNFNCLGRILPGTIAQDLGIKEACNDREHSKRVIIILIIVLEVLDPVRYLPNGSAPHTECVII